MTAPCRDEGRFARFFRARYLRSLDDYRFFYDDFATYGDPAEADNAVYFVPGINGTAGQIRFVLPSLFRVFGRRLYVKSLYLPEFSSRRPTWMKYSLAHVDRKLAQIRADVDELLAGHERVIVVASSSGFYDFAAAAVYLPEDVLRNRIHLIWGSCAPDQFDPSPWERVFYPLNGFEYDGHRWFAYPNHNLFQGFNPETSHSHRWREGAQQRCFRKADLESRFHLGGLEWSYVSPSQLGAATRHVVGQISAPLPCPTCALVATNDGYWQGRPIHVIERTLQRYLTDVTVTFKPASHLWVVTPTNVTEVLRHVKADTTTRSFSGSAPIVPPAESPDSPRFCPAQRGRFDAPLFSTFS